MLKDKNWSSYPNNIDRKKDGMEFSTQTKRLMFGEILRQTVGFGGQKNRRWDWWCSPELIRKNLLKYHGVKVGYSTVKRFYDELQERKVLTYSSERWEQKDRMNTRIFINKNTDEWIEKWCKEVTK